MVNVHQRKNIESKRKQGWDWIRSLFWKSSLVQKMERINMKGCRFDDAEKGKKGIFEILIFIFNRSKTPAIPRRPKDCSSGITLSQ